jgi:hypothetical protein
LRLIRFGRQVGYEVSAHASSDPRIDHTSKAGLGGSLSFGKKWWLSPKRGAGRRDSCVVFPDPGAIDGLSLSYFGSSALFSASYNWAARRR